MVTECFEQTRLEGIISQVPEGMDWWWRRIQVTSARAVQSATVNFSQVLPSLDPKHSMAYTCSSLLFISQERHVCHPTIHSWQWYENLGTVCTWSSIGRVQDARTCMLQDEVLILKYFLCGMWRRHPGMWILAWFWEKRNPCNQVLSLHAQSRKAFHDLWSCVYKQLKEDLTQRLMINHRVELIMVVNKQLQGTITSANPSLFLRAGALISRAEVSAPLVMHRGP